jgi:hypothetical protein
MNVAVNIHLTRGGSQVEAHAKSKVADVELDAKVNAPVAQGDVGWMAEKLAVARALRALEIDLMAEVHELIDRSIADA